MAEPQVGMMIYGFCNGYFGRDSYGPKRIEAIGEDWLVVRENGRPNFAAFDSHEQMMQLIEEWKHEWDWEQQAKEGQVERT